MSVGASGRARFGTGGSWPLTLVLMVGGVVICVGLVYVAIGHTAMLLAGFAALLLLIVMLAARAALVPEIGLAVACLVAVALPTYGSPSTLRAEAIGLSLLCNLLALIRSVHSDASKLPVAGIFLCTYFAWSGIGQFVQLAGVNRESSALTTLWLISSCFVASKVTLRVALALKWILVAAALSEALLALLELVGRVQPLWGYLGTGKSLQERENLLVPAFQGRAVATMAQSIPLAMFLGAAVALVVLGGMGMRWWLRAAILATLALGLAASGTRSAAIALAACLVCGFLISPTGVARIRNALLLAGIAFVCLSTLSVSSLLGLDGVTSTLSYQNREASIQSLATAFQRPFGQVLLGGFSPDRAASSAGNPFDAIDNQFVTSLSTAGLVGAVLLVAALVAGLVVGNRLSRSLVLFLAIMMFSFDLLVWDSGAILAITALVAVSSPLASQRLVPESRHAEGSAFVSDPTLRASTVRV